MRTALFGFVASVCLLSNAFALNFPSDVDFFAFPGWNHALITGAGQTFNDVFGTVDVTVTAFGSFSLPSKVNGSPQEVIVDGMLTPGSDTFVFTLSAPLPIVVAYQTVDSQEKLIIGSTGTMTNTQLLGSPSMLTTAPGILQIMGTGLGVSPTGASRGYVEVSSVSSFTVTHEGLKNNKFEAFRIGTVVPEPTGLALLFGLLPLALRRRG